MLKDGFGWQAGITSPLTILCVNTLFILSAVPILSWSSAVPSHWIQHSLLYCISITFDFSTMRRKFVYLHGCELLTS